MTWGKIQGKTERAGKPMPAIDSLIAATAITHHLTVATRNISDMNENRKITVIPKVKVTDVRLELVLSV